MRHLINQWSLTGLNNVIKPSAHFVNDAVIRTALREAFGLKNQKIRWATDEHYNFDHKIDPADIDDY